MDPVCQECKQKAEFICFCNDSYMCKGCRDAHKRKYKGPHKILLFNDPELDVLRASFKNLKVTSGNKGGSSPLPKKDPEDPPSRIEQKNNMKKRLKREIEEIAKFKSDLMSSIKDQAKSLVQEIINQHSVSTQDFNMECASREKILTEALGHLNSNSDISSNLFLCKLLDFPSLDIDLIDLKSTVKEESISLEDTLSLTVELVRFEETNQAYDYYNTNKDNISAPLKALFEELISEKHFKTSSIKLNKVLLLKEGLLQVSILLPQFTNLKVLQLTENELGVEGIKRIGPLIVQLQNIRKLSICKNALKGPGGKAFAPFLKDLKELLVLDLSGNKFGLEGIKPICASLSFLTKLKSLKLMNNLLADDCANSLMTCFSALKKLKTLRLNGNNFHSEEQAIIEDHVPDKCDVKF